MEILRSTLTIGLNRRWICCSQLCSCPLYIHNRQGQSSCLLSSTRPPWKPALRPCREIPLPLVPYPPLAFRFLPPNTCRIRGKRLWIELLSTLKREPLLQPIHFKVKAMRHADADRLGSPLCVGVMFPGFSRMWGSSTAILCWSSELKLLCFE